MAKLTIPVSGMHCASCQSRVQAALARTPGVSDASVNLMLNNATVTFDERATRPEQLVDAIRSTGYDASLPRADVSAFQEQEEQDRARAREFRELARKTAVSLAIAALLMVLPMVEMGASTTPWIEL